MATEVADKLVVFFRRPVNQSHFVRSSALSLDSPSLQDLQRWAIANITEVTSVAMMAEHVSFSQRHR